MSVNPDRIRIARESRGLTQTGMARKITGFSQTLISRLEDGSVVELPEEKLASLSRGLDYPVGFFSDQQVVEPVDVFYRKRSSLSKKHLSQLNARIAVLQLALSKWLPEVSPNEAEKLPYIPSSRFDYGAPAVAQEIRRLWGIESGKIRDLADHIESHGCVIIYFDFKSPKFDGLSFRTSTGWPVILLNPLFPPSRLRFTCVHELGHLIMHEGPSEKVEAEANAFASEFLMPEDEIKEDLKGRITMKTLPILKARWGVSMAALIHRAGDLDSIWKDRYSKYLYTELSRLGYRKNEPHENVIPKITPRLLERKMLEEGLMQEGQLGEFTITEKEIRKMLEK